MEQAFNWINQFFEVLVKFIPHLLIIRSTEAGVLFKRGKIIKPIGPGLHWYWPLVTEYYVTAVVRQTQNLPTQAAVTKDKVAVAVSGIIVYKIKDVVAAFGKTFDFNDTMNDVSMTAILPYICSRTYDELIMEINSGQAQEALTKSVRRAVRKYGVAVAFVGLTDFTKATALNHIGVPWQSLPAPSGTT